MMLNIWKLNLQLFADGGDGGPADGGEAADAGEEIPGSVPARARKNYAAALKANKASSAVETNADTATTTQEEAKKPTYAELIASEDYKAEHQKDIQQAIEKRLKNHKRIEDAYTKQADILSLIGQKYGLDSNTENYLDVLSQKVNEDDSYYEKYAEEHDLDPQSARKMVTLERQVRANEEAKAKAEREAAQKEEIANIMRHSEQTKAIYPNFDINTEIQNPAFARMLKAVNGDTTVAYRALHWNEIMSGTVSQAVNAAATQTANAVKANKARPSENGLGNSAPSISTNTDFSRMNLSQLRAWAAEQNRLKKR